MRKKSRLALLMAVMTCVPSSRVIAQEAARALQPLQRTISPLKVSAERLDRIIERLGGSAGVRVDVNWDKCDLKPDSRFDASLSGLTLGTALGALFGPEPRMDANGAVTVGEPAEVGSVTERYAVGDLARTDSRSLERGMEHLQQLVERNIRSESWRDNGGTQGLFVAGDTLVVSQTRGAHVELQELLRFLRETRRPQPYRVADQRPAVSSVMNHPVENAAFTKMPLREVIDRLTVGSDANVVVDVDSLDGIGESLDTPVSIDLSKLTVARAFDVLIWQQLGGKVAADIDTGVLTIRAREQSNHGSARRAYVVRGIIDGLSAEPPTAPDDPLHTPLWERRAGADAADSIVRLIEDTVDSENWKDNGGNVGHLEFFAGNLIVTATPRAHGQLRALLTGMNDAVSTRPAAAPPAEPSPPAPATAKPFSDALIDLDFDGTPFEAALKRVAAQTDARMFVNWKVLEAGGIDTQTPVKLKIKGVKGRTAVNLILDAAGGGQLALSAVVEDDGIVRISSAEDNQRGSVAVKFYNIQSLIESAVRARRVFNANQPNARGPTGEDAIDGLTKVIEDNIDTESWKDNGGAVGSLRVFANTLIISASPGTQEKVAAFLAKLKAEVAGPQQPAGQ